jgi:hypothetical protein
MIQMTQVATAPDACVSELRRNTSDIRCRAASAIVLGVDPTAAQHSLGGR